MSFAFAFFFGAVGVGEEKLNDSACNSEERLDGLTPMNRGVVGEAVPEAEAASLVLALCSPSSSPLTGGTGFAGVLGSLSAVECTDWPSDHGLSRSRVEEEDGRGDRVGRC